MSKIGEHEEDPILLFSFLKGDNNAFSSIYNKYVDELFAYGIGLGFERETLRRHTGYFLQILHQQETVGRCYSSEILLISYA